MYGNHYDIHLNNIDAENVRIIASEFCYKNQKIFKVSDDVIEKGCINTLFNQLFLKINDRRDRLFEEEEKLKAIRKKEKLLKEQKNALKVL